MKKIICALALCLLAFPVLAQNAVLELRTSVLWVYENATPGKYSGWTKDPGWMVANTKEEHQKIINLINSNSKKMIYDFVNYRKDNVYIACFGSKWTLQDNGVSVGPKGVVFQVTARPSTESDSNWILYSMNKKRLEDVVKGPLNFDVEFRLRVPVDK